MSRAHLCLHHRLTALAGLAPSLRRLASLPLLGALVLGPACKSEAPEQAKPGPEPAAAVEEVALAEAPSPAPTGALTQTRDTAPIADHEGVIATMQLPSGTAVSDVAAVLDWVQPGASMLLELQLPTLLAEAVGFELGGAKLDAPISMVMVSPRIHERPVAMLLEARDPAGLRAQAEAAGYAVQEREGRLLIGPAAVVAAAEGFAFTHLAQAPDHSEFIVYPATLLSIYADEIGEGLDQASAAMATVQGMNAGTVELLRSYIKGALAIGGETQRVVFSVSLGPDSADLITRIYPTPASVLASFVEAQVPADHALLAKLPSPEPGGAMVMSGDLRAGGARAALVEFGVEFMGSMYSALSKQEWAAIVNPWLDNLDGRFAVTTGVVLGANPGAGLNLRAIMGTTDSEALREAWRAMLEQMVAQSGFEMMGMKVEVRYAQDVLTHAGVTVDHYATSIDASKLPEQERAAMEAAGGTEQRLHLASFDGLAAMTTADEEGSSIRALIDGSRGQASTLQPSAGLAATLAAATARGDSAILYFDLASVAGANPQVPVRAISFSLGKAGAALELRVALRK